MCLLFNSPCNFVLQSLHRDTVMGRHSASEVFPPASTVDLL